MPAKQRFALLPLLATAVAVLTGCASAHQPTLTWTTWRSAEAGFEIAMPEGHSSFHDRSSHAFGEHPEHAVYWRNPALGIGDLGLKLIAAGYYELDSMDARKDAAFVLDSFAREEAQRGGTSTRGRMIEYTADSVAGYPARRMRSFVDNGKADSLYLFGQFVLRDGRVYHLRMNGYKGALDTQSMELVRRSFRFISRT